MSPTRRARIIDYEDPPLNKAQFDDLLALAWTEAVFQAQVEEWYFLAGWSVVWHDNFSLRNDPGFPDIMAAGQPAWLLAAGFPPGVHYRELKKKGGSLSPEQKRFGAAIQADGGNWAARWTKDWRLVREECGLEWLLAKAQAGDAWAIRYLVTRQAELVQHQRERKLARQKKRHSPIASNRL